MSKVMLPVAVFCFLLTVGTVGASADQGLYLHVISVDVVEPGEGEAAGLRLFIHNADAVAAALGKRGMHIDTSDKSSLTVSLAPARRTLSGESADWRGDTFVIDYGEQPVVDMLAAQSWQPTSGTPSVEALETVVFEWIEDKTYKRGFDFASTVARTRSGDCTEHAVLLAAAARAVSVPARVIFGILLVDGASAQVFGHAWTEVWDGESWQLLDATKPEATADERSLYYIPLGIIENESPGYAMDLMSLSLRLPARVELIRSE